MKSKSRKIKHLILGALLTLLCLECLIACQKSNGYDLDIQDEINRLNESEQFEIIKKINNSEKQSETTKINQSNQQGEFDEGLLAENTRDTYTKDQVGNSLSIDSRPFLDQKVYSKDIYESDTVLLKDYTPLNANDFDSIVGGIIPHHNLAHVLIHDFYKLVAEASAQEETPYDLIVVISPNHKSIGNRFQIVQNDFITYDGIVEVDQTLIDQLQSYQDINIASETMISQEHGQLVHMPYIEHYFPEAKVLSIVITEYRNDEGIEHVVNEIYPLLQDKNVLYIASIDFSHYLTLLEAEEKDAYTYEQLAGSNIKNLIQKSNDYIDSPSTYAMFMEFMKHYDGSPKVKNHSNAAVIMNDPFMVETTSYFQVIYD